MIWTSGIKELYLDNKDIAEIICMEVNMRVAILVEEMYEDMELQYPLFRLREEGLIVDIVGTDKGKEYRGKHGYPTVSDLASSEVSADDYDGVIVPGGYSPDRMRRCPDTIRFVKDMCNKGKIVAAICHGPWMMASCCDLKGKKVTGFFSIKDDLANAGAEYVDREVVVSGNLITSRGPQDLIVFTREIIRSLNTSNK